MIVISLSSTSILNGFSLTGLEFTQAAESPLSLLEPAMGRMERSDMLRMWRAESHITSILLMVGAACTKVTLLPGIIGILVRNSSDRELGDSWTENCKRLPRDVPAYRQPTLMSSVSI